MTREATLHLISKGVRMMGIDAVTFDPPVWAMFEREQFWEAHRVMWEEDYWHLENSATWISYPLRLQAVRAAHQVGWDHGSSGSCGGDSRRMRATSERRSEPMNQIEEKTALENAHGSAVVWFTEEACREEVAGGKGASLARMTTEGLPVPPGFVIPSYVLQKSIDAERMLELAASHSTSELQELVAATEPPREEITAAYENLVGGAYVQACGQQEGGRSFLRRRGGLRGGELRRAAGDLPLRRRCGGSLQAGRGLLGVFFSERALFYRSQKGSLEDLRMAVVVQKMVDPEKSGVIFTVDPSGAAATDGCRGRQGHREQVVSGEVTPDHYSDRRGKSSARRSSMTASLPTRSCRGSATSAGN